MLTASCAECVFCLKAKTAWRLTALAVVLQWQRRTFDHKIIKFLAKMYLPILSSTSLYFHKTVIMRRLAEEAATLESSRALLPASPWRNFWGHKGCPSLSPPLFSTLVYRTLPSQASVLRPVPSPKRAQKVEQWILGCFDLQLPTDSCKGVEAFNWFQQFLSGRPEKVYWAGIMLQSDRLRVLNKAVN